MAKVLLPPQSYLLQTLWYDPETGKFIWRPRLPERFKAGGHNTPQQSANIWNRRYAGKEAFKTVSKAGYGYATIDAVKYLAHRVAWKLVTGRDPEGEIDHINGVTTDNRFCNLREVSHSDNGRNLRLKRTNWSGFNGVSWLPKRQRWCARIQYEGRNIHLGEYRDIDDAVNARKAADIKYGFHANHSRKSAGAHS